MALRQTDNSSAPIGCLVRMWDPLRQENNNLTSQPEVSKAASKSQREGREHYPSFSVLESTWHLSKVLSIGLEKHSCHPTASSRKDHTQRSIWHQAKSSTTLKPQEPEVFVLISCTYSSSSSLGLLPFRVRIWPIFYVFVQVHSLSAFMAQRVLPQDELYLKAPSYLIYVILK